MKLICIKVCARLEANLDLLMFRCWLSAAAQRKLKLANGTKCELTAAIYQIRPILYHWESQTGDVKEKCHFKTTFWCGAWSHWERNFNVGDTTVAAKVLDFQINYTFLAFTPCLVTDIDIKIYNQTSWEFEVKLYSEVNSLSGLSSESEWHFEEEEKD